MTRKITYLILALCLPGLIFVFLKLFGKNQFDIPVYYTNGIDHRSSCFHQSTGQYQVPESLMREAGWDGSHAVIFYSDTTQEAKANLRSIHDDLSEQEIQLVNIFPADSTKGLGCALLLQLNGTAVLVDSDRKIRGYYKPADLDESDRLKAEVLILLKKY